MWLLMMRRVGTPIGAGRSYILVNAATTFVPRTMRAMSIHENAVMVITTR